ncbi:MAG: S8 family serine peptidase [candidate division Zixibacteria bacterium]|nr:S8 family serine peptidase [candidate division Zixibacteria bacterium]
MKCFWLLSVLTAIATCSFASGSRDADYAPGVLYVTFRPGSIDSIWHDAAGVIRCGIPYIDSLNQANHCRDFRFIGHPALSLSKNDYHIILPENADIPSLAAAYRAEPKIRWARADHYAKLQFTPNDPYFSGVNPGNECYQWNMDEAHCKFEKAWDITQGDTSVVIAIIDNGFFYNHPDIKGNVWINGPEDFNGNGSFEPWRSDSTVPGDLNGIDNDGNGFIDDVIGYNFPYGGPPDPYIQIDGHGTFVASIASAVTNNLAGISGAGFKCRLMLISAYRESPAAVSNLVSAIQYATKMQADVINMSWVVPANPFFDSAMALAIDSAYARNILLVGGAGNSAGEQVIYPAAYHKVLSVTGVEYNDVLHSKVTYNDSVDLSAPVRAWGAYYKGISPPHQPIYNYSNSGPGYHPPCENGIPCVCPEWDTLPPLTYGTSFSAPLVAGAAALVKSIYPNMTNLQIMAKLRTSTDNIDQANSGQPWAGKIGTGRLNAFKAVTYFDTIPRAANDTTLSGTVYVSGDIIVPAGKTLTLAAGTRLKFIPGDVMGSIGNPSPNKSQIIVKGTLRMIGAQSDSIVLTSFSSTPANGDWSGILVAHPGRMEMEFARISYADTAISVQGDTATVLVYNSTFNYFKTAAVYSKSAKTRLGGIVPIPNPPDCGKNNFLMNTATSGAKAVIKSTSPGGTVKAEGNWWSQAPPQSVWFVGSVDRTPYLTGPAHPDSCGGGLPKIAGTTIPLKFELRQNYPNPFNANTNISFHLVAASKVELVVYNILGARVRTLVDDTRPAGTYEAVFDGRDDKGRTLSSGTYFYKLTAGDKVVTKQMVLVK